MDTRRQIVLADTLPRCEMGCDTFAHGAVHNEMSGIIVKFVDDVFMFTSLL